MVFLFPLFTISWAPFPCNIYMYVYISHTPTEEFNFLIWDSFATVLDEIKTVIYAVEVRVAWKYMTTHFYIFDSFHLASHYETMTMIHTTWASECSRRCVSRARGSTQEQYKQEKQKSRVQISGFPGVVPYPLEHDSTGENLWSWRGVYKDSCADKSLLPLQWWFRKRR